MPSNDWTPPLPPDEVWILAVSVDNGREAVRISRLDRMRINPWEGPMHGTVGGQLDEMAKLASTFRNNASGMQNVRGSIESVLSSTMWSGPAAARFREAWHQFAPTLDRLHEALIDAGTEVDRRRAALDAATR